MILYNMLVKPYEEYTIRSKIPLECDYCGEKFERIKKSIKLLNKNIKKDSCGSKSCCNKKRQEVFFLIYGMNPINAEAVKNKTRKNNLIKHGNEEYFSTKKFKQQRENTLVKKYGVSSPLQDKKILEKLKKTCLIKYGVENYSKTKEFSEKAKKRSGNKDQSITKRKETNLIKYGVENYTQTKEYWDKRKKTCLNKYGVEHPSQDPKNRNKAKETNLKRYGKDNYAKTKEFKDHYSKLCLEKYGVTNPLLLQKNQTYGKTQLEIKNWLNSLGFSFETNYSIITGKEIDLYDSNKKIAIEYCGLFWHNEQSPSPRLSKYHYEKYCACESKGIRLFTIFEDEWKLKKEQCKSRLKSILGISPKIYARKCKIEKCKKEDFKNFCSDHHIQGSNNLGLVFYSLLFEGNIVAAMSFGRHPRNKKTIVLDRLCFKSNVTIVGGASKLFKACKMWGYDNDYREVITWSDNRWSEGKIYKTLGFTLEEDLGPDYSYVKFKSPIKRISKQSQKKSNTGCPKETTEKEYALKNGLARIWDCGKKRWSCNLESS